MKHDLSSPKFPAPAPAPAPALALAALALWSGAALADGPTQPQGAQAELRGAYASVAAQLAAAGTTRMNVHPHDPAHFMTQVASLGGVDASGCVWTFVTALSLDGVSRGTDQVVVDFSKVNLDLSSAPVPYFPDLSQVMATDRIDQQVIRETDYDGTVDEGSEMTLMLSTRAAADQVTGILIRVNQLCGGTALR